MATRDENLNKIREQLSQVDKQLDSLSDEQLAAIAAGQDYSYGSRSKFMTDELVDVYIPISGFLNGLLFTLFCIDTSESFSGVITGVRQDGARWVYNIMTFSGVEHKDVDEKYISLQNTGA